MGNLVAEHDSQRRLGLSDGQKALEDYNLSAGHTEGIDVLVLHKVEFPLEIVELAGESILPEVGAYGVGKPLTDALHHLGVGLVGRLLGCLHILVVLLRAQREHLGIVYQERLLATGDGHRASGSARGETHCQHKDKKF